MIKCLLVGPQQEGGEGVYVREIFENPPTGVTYELSQRFHAGVPSARSHAIEEVLLNRLLHPWLRYGFGFRSFTVDNSVDLIHVHSHPVRIRSRRRVPIVMSAGSSHYINVRDYEHWSERKIARRYARAQRFYGPLRIHDELLNTAGVARIYTFSEWARRIYLERGIPAHKIDVIYPGFDIPALHGRTGDRTNRFLFVGRDFARKGGPLVLSAFGKVYERDKAATLTVVTRDTAEVRPQPGVRVLPFMDRQRLYDEVYPNADVFVMPTLAEGWGFTNAEAMSFGLPVITTNINAMAEIVEADVTGVLIAPGDGDALVAAMQRFAESRDLCLEMGARGRARFIDKFSRDAMRARLAEFYHAALRSAA